MGFKKQTLETSTCDKPSTTRAALEANFGERRVEQLDGGGRMLGRRFDHNIVNIRPDVDGEAGTDALLLEATKGACDAKAKAGCESHPPCASPSTTGWSACDPSRCLISILGVTSCHIARSRVATAGTCKSASATIAGRAIVPNAFRQSIPRYVAKASSDIAARACHTNWGDQCSRQDRAGSRLLRGEGWLVASARWCL